MKWYWKLTIALGFVGMVAMGAAAFAQSDSSNPTATTTASTQVLKAGGLRGLGARIVHGDLTLNTRRGLVTAKVDGGVVTAIDSNAHTLTIKRADGQSVSFTASDATRVRREGEKASFSDIKVGDHVLVIQLDRGTGFVVAAIRDRGAGQADPSAASAAGSL